MIEAYEDEWVVRVRAQVMSRDEGTGGWVALGGGGLANVMLGRRPKNSGPKRASGGDSSTDDSNSRHTHLPTYEYFIYGKRIADQTVVLSCTIKKDFQYNKVMPTFHHWVTDEKRFGLTFQTAADARAFDRGVRRAVQDLLDGRGGAWPSLHKYNKNSAPNDDDEENNIFECLNLPSDSRSSSENSTASRPTRRGEQTPILSAITLPARSTRSTESLVNKELVLKAKLSGTCLDTDKIAYVDDGVDSDNYPYVHLTSMHEFSPYPNMGKSASDEKIKQENQPEKDKTNTTVIDKKPPKQDSIQARIKCRHCHEWYLESANGAGACQFAPDCFRSCIDTISCIKCAQCMLYHCMSDSEGEFTQPCACAPPHAACAKRWLGMGLLSLFVPCLWCYAPLRCLHKAARACKMAGGEHAPRVSPHT